jgi:hypothetical protein
MLTTVPLSLFSNDYANRNFLFIIGRIGRMKGKFRSYFCTGLRQTIRACLPIVREAHEQPDGYIGFVLSGVLSYLLHSINHSGGLHYINSFAQATKHCLVIAVVTKITPGSGRLTPLFA